MTAEREREIDSRLADWVDGTLTGRERERFLAELRVNAQLRKDLAEYERTVATMREALQASTVKVDLADRVMAAIAEEERVAAEKRADGPFAIRRLAKDALRKKAVVWSLVSAAALLAVTIVLSTWPTQPSVELQATGERVAEPTTLDDFLKMQKALQPQPPAAPVASAPGTPAPSAKPEAPSSPPEGRTESPKAGDRAGTDDSTANADTGGVRPSSPGGGTPPADAHLVEESVAKDAPNLHYGSPRVGADSSRGAPPQAADRQPPPATLPRSAGESADKNPVESFSRDSAGGSRERAAGAKEDAKTEAYRGNLGRISGPESERLPLVLLQGDATDGLDSDAKGFTGGFDDARSKSAEAAPTAERILEQFFANQMRLEPATPQDSVALPPPATLRLRTIEVPAPRTNEPGRASDTPATVERTWLVEGTKDEVQAVVKRLAVFAKTRNLVLKNGEELVPVPSAPEGANERRAEKEADVPEAKKKDTQRGAAPTKARLLLRFRLLRR